MQEQNSFPGPPIACSRSAIASPAGPGGMELLVPGRRSCSPATRSGRKWCGSPGKGPRGLGIFGLRPRMLRVPGHQVKPGVPGINRGIKAALPASRPERTGDLADRHRVPAGSREGGPRTWASEAIATSIRSSRAWTTACVVADLLARAGAISVSEFCLVRRPRSFRVPTATGRPPDVQMHALSDRGAAMRRA